MKKPTPKYKLVYEDDGNVTFLNYGKGEYNLYRYRMVWTRQNHHSQTSDWFLIVHQQHINGLDLMPAEIKLAQRVYNELTSHVEKPVNST